MEYALPRSLNDLAESFNIVETRGYATYDPSKTYTIYLEYCPRGSLADLVKRYQKIRTLRDENGTPISGRIPVRVMWSIFEALASTVCLMYQGHFPGDGETSRNDFSAFVHRDIKPENIFLANPDSNFWPQVPVAKMGDFGLAVLADDVEKQGTNGWKAPEMIEYDAPFEDSEDEFLEDLPDYNQLYPPHVLCDVWSLGRVMLALMNLEDPVDVPELRFDEDDVAPGPFNDPPDKTSGKHDQSYYAGVKEYYPDEMRRLVERCLQMNPEDRVDPDTLWNEVHSHVAACKGLRGRPLREMQRDCLGRELLLMEHVETRDLVKGQWAT
ncbi:hypothetical protein DOTSEDRAFT_125401 [Dothistroma septosporum NZE10]|uniref:non-specific serine/threonine protein kinase n=1 Tax=Dothistroma septosporum (strain NZE10 / CBS 128990) TaxID=675120 RepID=N1PWL5_DOTSN|nr:hypothetical protein DOTSEDRAFT_125401 [Dothistroma septosporum NZE10]